MKKVLSFLLMLCILLSVSAFAEEEAGGILLSDITVWLDDEEFPLNLSAELLTDEDDLALILGNGDAGCTAQLVFTDDSAVLLFPEAGRVGLCLPLSEGEAKLLPRTEKEALKAELDALSEEEFVAHLKETLTAVAGVEFPQEGDYELSFSLDRDGLLRFFELLLPDESRQVLDRLAAEETLSELDSVSVHADIAKKDGVISSDIHFGLYMGETGLWMELVSEDFYGGRNEVSISLSDESGYYMLDVSPEEGEKVRLDFNMWDYTGKLSCDFISVEASLAISDGAPEEVDLNEYLLLDATALVSEAADEEINAFDEMMNVVQDQLTGILEEESVAALLKYVGYGSVQFVIGSGKPENALRIGDVFTSLPDFVSEKNSLAGNVAYDRKLAYVYVYFEDEDRNNIMYASIVPKNGVQSVVYQNGQITALESDAWVIERCEGTVKAVGNDCEISFDILRDDIELTDEDIIQLLDGFVMPTYTPPELKSSEAIEEKLNDSRVRTKPDKAGKKEER